MLEMHYYALYYYQHALVYKYLFFSRLFPFFPSLLSLISFLPPFPLPFLVTPFVPVRLSYPRSSDWRMWQGLANCYTKLSRHTDAIKAYKRAVIGGSTDLSILVTLAQLLELEGDMTGAASFQSQIISETTVPGTGELTPMAAKAHLWLARMEIGRGDLEEAERHVNETLKGHYVLSPLFRRVYVSLSLCSLRFSPVFMHYALFFGLLCVQFSCLHVVS